MPPLGLLESAFGSRLTAMSGPLYGRFRLIMREAAAAFAERFGVPFGPGSVSTLCQEVAAALDEPCEAVRARVEVQRHDNVDETGWKQAGERQ